MNKWHALKVQPTRIFEHTQPQEQNGLPKDYPPGEHYFSLDRPEGTRYYYVWVPQSYANSTANFPVHLSFHGLGDNCYDFGHATGLIDLSETHNYLYVYACGTDSLLGTAWNAGTCCMFPSAIDDVGFSRAIVAKMQQDFRVDTKNVFASGFSNGGMMAEILGCEAADFVKATASVAGVVELLPGNAQGLVTCTTDYAKFNKPVSTLNIHGTLDFVVPWTGDELLGFPPIPDDFAAWGKNNHCQGDPVTTWQAGSYSNQRYQTCDKGSVVEVVIHSGGGHSWPSDSNFDTASYVVAFFESAK
jgi:poly(3-hydroxybutyrate) depolymerase